MTASLAAGESSFYQISAWTTAYASPHRNAKGLPVISSRRHLLLRLALAGAAALPAAPSRASDHLDTPTVTADPAADIGDLYAWTSADGRRLNIVLDIVGNRFSDQVDYV